MSYISEHEQKTVEHLKEIGQGHLVENIFSFSPEERQQFLAQIDQLQKSYPGGLQGYTEKGKALLQDSLNNVNPFEGYTPEIPQGEKIDFQNLEQMNRLESLGVQQLEKTCFVLVAGGLGERLGYQGIKVEIPVELLTQQCFLQYYIKYILAFQKRCQQGTQIPLAIMTSDDTYTLTVKLLEENEYFGMAKEQVIIMKQEKVPAMKNNDAHFAQTSGKLLIETKPHGHGDVHCLLYQNQLHKKWVNQGKKWVFFFQDTNPLVFRSLVSVLGVSAERNLEVNSITVPRKPGEAVGSICKLQHKDGKTLTMNVEYNQLDSLLKNTIGKEEVDSQGFSVFPGNINSLVFSLPEYVKILNETQGMIAEFINPKYADSTKTLFKSPTRLECMMQDYPKLLQNADRCGFTQIDRGYSFAAVKNDIVSAAQKQKQGLSPECSGSCEEAFYTLNANILRICGAQVEEGVQSETYADIQYNFGPKIVLDPEFGVTLQEIREKVKNVKISKDSSLIVKSNVKLENVDLDGHLVVDAETKVFENKDQKYNKFEAVDVQKVQEQYIKIRGYQFQ